MALYFIGLGLHDKMDISLKGKEFIEGCSKLYLDSYTGVLNTSVEELEEFYQKGIVRADRDMVEKQAEETILADAKNTCVGFLVVGDPMSATTHVDLMLRAKELGIPTYVIPNASVITAVGVTGLQVYKFGKVTSVPYAEDNFRPQTCYDVLKENQEIGCHTLMLLDLRPEQGKYMSVNETINFLLEIEEERQENVFSKETQCIGCARLGEMPPVIKSGSAEELLGEDFGEPVHCLIVPGRMHFMEMDAFKAWRVQAPSKKVNLGPY